MELVGAWLFIVSASGSAPFFCVGVCVDACVRALIFNSRLCVCVYCRHVMGGIYFDADVLFLRDMW